MYPHTAARERLSKKRYGGNGDRVSRFLCAIIASHITTECTGSNTSFMRDREHSTANDENIC
jgi:hypothetical protein